jgi:uncharacterized protein (TIGR03435 family)
VQLSRARRAFRQMLQTLLVDRFQLKIHHVEKDLPVYNLTVDKGGPKLRPSAADTMLASTMRSPSRFGIHIVNAQMAIEKFADMIFEYAGRPVFKRTGLDG